jgi:hypothetical protein
MRKFNFTKQLLAAALLVSTCLTSCQKTEMEDVNPFGSTSVNTAVRSSSEVDRITISINPNPVIAGSSVIITVDQKGNAAGTLYLQEYKNSAWENVANINNRTSDGVVTYTIQSATAEDNGRVFRGFFDKVHGMDSHSASLTLVVQSTCEYSLVPSTAVTNANDNGLYTFETTYTLRTCDRAVKGVKLQGGLTSKATFLSASLDNGTAATVKATGKNGSANTVITWDNINMGPNQERTFKVIYSKGLACGTTDVLTGDWSAKGLFADDNSPSIIGYNNQQQFTANDCN